MRSTSQAILRLVSGLLILLAVAACAPPAAVQEDVSERPDARVVEIERVAIEDPGRAAEQLEALLVGARATEKDGWVLKAAELWLQADQPDRALRLLQGPLSAEAPAESQQLQNILLAEALLAQGRPAQAMSWLASLPTPLADQLEIKRLHVLARAHAAQNETTAMVVAMNRRDGLLTEPADQATNRRETWNFLLASRADLAEKAGQPQLSQTERTWLELGAIGQSRWQDPQGYIAKLESWRAANPAHPASLSLVDQIVAEFRSRSSYPEHIAVLLPTRGRFAKAAQAVRDGFLAAHFERAATQGDSANLPRISFYDTSDDVSASYQAARTDGAEFIIGPLSKEAIESLAAGGPIELPTLALNRMGEAPSGQPTLFQFALSPEEEARQVAERAALDGHQNAIALVPGNPWGQRIFAAFAFRFEELGGKVVGFRAYDEDQFDHSAVIKRLLMIDQSESRHRALTNLIGRAPEFQPRRRQDVDMVFMAAFPRQGRLIRPQLRFHRASTLPIYATSHVYSGWPNTKADRDLDGVIFPDMPWNLSPDDFPLRQALSNAWPTGFQSQSRLYALGYDAFRLVPRLRNNPDGFANLIPGATGTLVIQPTGLIDRKLNWAVFRRGLPVPQTLNHGNLESSEQ
ncbi:MAG: penicillin-binding protein activator [Pseudomonadota bacterium]|nr:penicillin-binding protein activator [Pseudomonadota bacterium]